MLFRHFSEIESRNAKRKKYCKAYEKCRNEWEGSSQKDRPSQRKNRSIQTARSVDLDEPLDASRSTRFSSSLLQKVDLLLRNKSAKDEIDDFPMNLSCLNNTKISKQNWDKQSESGDKNSKLNSYQYKIKEVKIVNSHFH